MAGLAVVTGASSGIGAAYAERLARDGWELMVVARRRDRLEELAERLRTESGATVSVVGADLAQRDQLVLLCDALADRPVEMLINNAALAHYMPFSELPPALADELVELNVLAPVRLTRAVAPGMQQRGSGAVINVASLLAFSGTWDAPHLPRRAVYAASKSFLVTFSQIVASELADSGVRVQVCCPGMVRTEFHSRQGIEMGAVPRMEPGDVVDASLRDLEAGVVVSIPGLADETAYAQVGAAQAALMGATRSTAPATRYRDS
jgi:short-subunit dehydrogenase